MIQNIRVLYSYRVPPGEMVVMRPGKFLGALLVATDGVVFNSNRPDSPVQKWTGRTEFAMFLRSGGVRFLRWVD